MFIYEILHKDKVHRIVESSLRSFGVKYRQKKNVVKIETPVGNGRSPQKVFKMPLSSLPLDLVSLSSGAIVHVPIFVSQASCYISRYIDLEGIFRKAGSKNRQREISIRINNGGALGDKDHGIDVANCLKAFFRDLPEPLIPYTYHDLFVRCVMLKKNRVEALLLACLLLPLNCLNTLAFFMEFLKKVASYEEHNKMGIVNLATVVGPNIMPLGETTMVTVQSRLDAHLTIIKVLIENAEKIGILPDYMAEAISPEAVCSTENELEKSDSLTSAKSKKKKYRSGSLTRKPHLSASNLNLRMLSGLKKIVGKNNSLLDVEPVTDLSKSIHLYSPSLKTGKKRKVMDTMYDQANQKKKLLEKTEKTKKVRLSFDRFVSRTRHKVVETEIKTCTEEPNPLTERRWSVGSHLSESKKNHLISSDEFGHGSQSRENKSKKWCNRKDYDDVFMDANVNLSDVSGEQASRESKRPKRVLVNFKRRTSDSLVCRYASADSDSTLPVAYINRYISKDDISLRRSSVKDLKDNQSEEYIKIPKSEYEEIKNRVSAIESRISQEFQCVANESRSFLTTHSVNKVQSEYEKTFEESSIESTLSADHLAKRLGKELKIRRSSEPKIIRSPSARKIGVLRRRSQEKPVSKRISRTSSWHISDRAESQSLRRTTLKLTNFYSNRNINSRSKTTFLKREESGASSLEADTFCNGETNARLEFLQKQLHTLITHTAEHTKGSLSDKDFGSIKNDVFHPVGNKVKSHVRRASSFHGNEFIDNSCYFNERVKELKKSSSQQSVALNNQCFTTESSFLERKEKVIKWKDAEKYFISEEQTMTPVPVTGRASVAKLRTQNAGVVLAKAKLFDETTRTSNSSELSVDRKIAHNQDFNRRQSARLQEIQSLDLDLINSPRRAVSRNKTISLKNSSAKVRRMKSHNISPIIKMKLTIVPTQDTSLHREYSDAKRSLNYQKENKSMETPPTRKETPILHESNLNTYNSVMNYKTPVIKKPLSVKTPKGTKSLVRRPAVEVRRTPLKAIGPLATPRRQSPRSILKTSHLSSRYFS